MCNEISSIYLITSSAKLKLYKYGSIVYHSAAPTNTNSTSLLFVYVYKYARRCVFFCAFRFNILGKRLPTERLKSHTPQSIYCFWLFFNVYFLSKECVVYKPCFLVCLFLPLVASRPVNSICFLSFSCPSLYVRAFFFPPECVVELGELCGAHLSSFTIDRDRCIHYCA